METIALKLIVLAFICLACLDFFRIKCSAKFVLYVPVFALMALFGSVSVYAFDVLTYSRMYYEQAAPTVWRIDLHPEYGYQWLQYLFHRMGFSYIGFKFLHILSILALFYFFLSNLTRFTGVFFALFYSKWYLVGVISHMRSAIVYPFGYLALILVERREYKKVLLLSAALSQFHLSGAFYGLLIALQKVPLNRLFIVFTVPIALAFNVFFSSALGSVGESIELRQSLYFGVDDEAHDVYGIEVLRRIAIVCLIFCLHHWGIFARDIERLAVKCVLFSIFIYIGFLDAKFVSERLGAIFGVFEPLLFVFWLGNVYNNRGEEAKNNLGHDPRVAWSVTLIYLGADIGLRLFGGGYFPGYDTSLLPG